MILLASLVLLGPLHARAQSPDSEAPPQVDPLSFPGEVEQVTVDVVVTDDDGVPITGLGPGDLEVYEDGKRQAIVTFDAFHAATPPQPAAPEPAAPAPAPRVSTNAVEPERRGRTFVIVFDDLHLTPATARRGREAVKAFVETGTREGDRVTLLSTASGVWWSSGMLAGREELLEVARNLGDGRVPDTAPDRLSDWEAMQIHVNRDVATMNRVQRRFETYGIATGTFQGQHVRTLSPMEDPVITTRAAEVYFAAAARNRITLEALERALEALVPIEGRKSLILVSDGFIYDRVLRGFRDVIESSRRANAAIYFVSGRGLEALPLSMDAEFSSALPQEDLGFAFAESAEMAEGSKSLAADTGGFTVENSNDLAGALKRISDETRSYYLVGYNPTDTARDGSYRKIRVEVPGRRNVRIRARKGYYAPSPEGAADVPSERSVFQTALDAPYDLDALSLRMTHVVREETLLDKARVFLVTEIDVREVGFEELPEGLYGVTLDLLLVATHRDTAETFRHDQTLEMKILPRTRESLARSWLPYLRELELPSGSFRARIVVRDRTSGKVGTVTHEFEVPDLGSFRVSTPVLSDVRQPTPEGQPGEGLAILARRDFPPGGQLYCQVDVYQAARDEVSAMPQVSMGYEVRRSDGALLTREPTSLITPTSLGALSRMIGFSLEGAAPGRYELAMSFADELSGETLELREPFRVAEPEAEAGERPAAPASGAAPGG